ncbi:hypothetical protein M0805_002021 [Coniferiporia weirii]|nr:hypothetical protein M0805_002021 [Coniferiporia weirii]
MSCVAFIPALNNTYGCLLIGSALWGAGTVQFYLYYDRFWNVDKCWLKLYVVIIWLLDTAHQALVMRGTYALLVTDFSDLASLGILDRTIIDTIALTGFTCALVQALFILRIWRLSRENYVLTGCVISLAVAEFILFMLYYAKARHYARTAQLHAVFGLQSALDVTAAVADISIAGVLVYLLYSRRSGFEKSNTVIKRLIMYTINTGLVTGLCAMAPMISGILWPNTYIYVLFYYLASRLYMNSILASLNSRRSRHDDSSEVSGQGLNVMMRSLFNHTSSTGTNTHGAFSASHVADVKVETVVELADSDDFKNTYGTSSEPDLEAARVDSIDSVPELRV